MRFLPRRKRHVEEEEQSPAASSLTVETLVEISPDDPLVAYLLSLGGPVEIETLELDSEAVAAMREAGIILLVPMISHGELISVLQLGRRLSDQPYSTDDRRLLSGLAAQAAPALRVAQLLRQQESEAIERERVAAELRVAQAIQQNFLPRELPTPTGWSLDAYYRPAREVGGDFYDFIELEGGELAIVVGDVTDKGVPAALVMASTRAVLRAAAQRLIEPSIVLERVNEQLQADIPPAMFVTCLYGVLNPATGSFRFANAGHNLPIHCFAGGADEPRATGMPLGLLPGVQYEEAKVSLAHGDTLVLYSDALPEAHGPDGDMFGFERVRKVAAAAGDHRMVEHLLAELELFTGADWEQEDDVTVVTLLRGSAVEGDTASEEPLVTMEIASAPGNEREAMEKVAAVVGAQLSTSRLEKLKTAVAEATMNAIEHGNRNDPGVPVELSVLDTGEAFVVRIADHGGQAAPERTSPDLEAKLRGDEPTRGWGLFLIREMVDQMNTEVRDGRHIVELVMKREGALDGS